MEIVQIERQPLFTCSPERRRHIGIIHEPVLDTDIGTNGDQRLD